MMNLHSQVCKPWRRLINKNKRKQQDEQVAKVHYSQDLVDIIPFTPQTHTWIVIVKDRRWIYRCTEVVGRPPCLTAEIPTPSLLSGTTPCMNDTTAKLYLRRDPSGTQETLKTNLDLMPKLMLLALEV
jgi:hypothetical protein